MKDMKTACEILDVPVTEQQLIAARVLESRGLRFCVEFGILNAVEKAEWLLDEECEKIRIQ